MGNVIGLPNLNVPPPSTAYLGPHQLLDVASKLGIGRVGGWVGRTPRAGPMPAPAWAWVSGVAVIPGEMALTRIPSGANSYADRRTSWLSPALATEYGRVPGRVPTARMDETTMIDRFVLLPCCMSRAAFCTQRKPPVRFSVITSSHCCRLISRNGLTGR